jgi:hypothetical protein
MNEGVRIRERGRQIVETVGQQITARAYRASNELRTAAMYVLRGQRHGRRYKIPNTGLKGKRGTGRYYTASKPGEPPAVRTGVLRSSWRATLREENQSGTRVMYPGIESWVPYIKYLEPKLSGREPGRKVKPRPFVDPIRKRAWPRVSAIYRRPYLK